MDGFLISEDESTAIKLSGINTISFYEDEEEESSDGIIKTLIIFINTIEMGSIPNNKSIRKLVMEKLMSIIQEGKTSSISAIKEQLNLF